MPIAGATLGFVVAYGWVSHQKEAKFRLQLANAEANWQAERTSLEAALTATKSRAGQARAAVSLPVLRAGTTNKITPQSILDTLIALDPKQTAEGRNQTLRQIIYELQRLADLGPEALPVIKKFLAQNKDVDYAPDDLRATGERGAPPDRGSSASFNGARIDFLVPPSLRLGLLDVLRQIGGEESETILAEVLATTGRGVEVAYLSRILEELAPGKYRDATLSAAKELLTTPPAIDTPNRLDLNARTYLYEVLKMQGDTNFAQTAQAKLLTPDGKIDRTTAAYLNVLLKEKALPLFYAAFKDERISNNHWEKSTLLKEVLNYVGTQDQANLMFAEMVVDASTPANLRDFTILSLYGAHRADTPYDSELIQGRLQLLENLKRDLKDERSVRAIAEAEQNLNKLLETETKPPETPAPSTPTPAAPGD